MLSLKNILTFAGVVSLAFVSTEVAAQGQTFGGIAENSEQNISAFKSLLVSASYLIGTAISIAGLWYFYKESKEEGRGHAKKGMFAILIGVALLLLPVIIGITANSTIGSSDGVEENIQTDRGF